MRRDGRTKLAAVALAAAALAGCGAQAESVVAAPSECLKSWNAESTAQTFGRHVYDLHESHRAQVAVLEAIDPNPHVAAGGACAVIFAVPESDVEYGYVGLVETDLGWASMQELARDDPAAVDQLQADASESANATVFPDGKLASN